MTTTTTLGELTGDYTFDTAHTRIGFAARHTVGPKVCGQFEEFGGSAHLDGDDPSKSKVKFTIQAGSIQTHNPQRDNVLRGKFLDLDNHPTIAFTLTGAQQVDETTFGLTGELTIRGVTKPVTVAVERTGAEHDPRGNARIHFKGRATINRKDWGVHWIAAVGLVGKKVALEFDVAVIRQT
ncbi:YceI family protein [Streptosporangium subroseum]|uniref:YceI family protein n=1 Tax=Streptosporangium subroseum TaxID=106412 RepID=UPI00308A8720|nr:YceI family protein [Streptosporangium subroseum]